MGKQNSKSIGNDFERQFSRELSLWVSEGKDDDVFWRDMSSGSKSTTRKKQGKENKNDGDLVAIDLKYKEFTDIFFIDTKSYKKFNAFIINHKNIKSNDIFLQWVKVCNDCPDNKIPMMICKIRDKSTPQFIIFPYYVNFHSNNSIRYNLTVDKKEFNFFVVLQCEFFILNKYDNFLNENN